MSDTDAKAIGPDQLAGLEEERAFLLRSLRDLDAEHAAGDIDEHDFATLRDGYTKRAADVLREIDAGRATLPVRRPTSWTRRLAVAVAVLAIGAGAGWFVARSSGERLAGDEFTGDVPSDDFAAMLAQARLQLSSDPAAAMELYGAVLQQRPDHAEALTYSGWLLYLIGRQSSTDELVEQAIEGAREKLTQAVEADPQYPDPHCFLAIMARSYDDDADTARAEGEACLALDPPAEVRMLIEPFLEGLD